MPRDAHPRCAIATQNRCRDANFLQVGRTGRVVVRSRADGLRRRRRWILAASGGRSARASAGTGTCPSARTSASPGSRAGACSGAGTSACADSRTRTGPRAAHPTPPPPGNTPPLPPLSSTVVNLDDNHQVGTTHWDDGDTTAGGQGSPAGGLECMPTMVETYHVHTHVSIFLDGQALSFPGQVGIVRRSAGDCFYQIHTHDKSGKIHIEAPAPGLFTLGQLFAIWGQPLKRRMSPASLASPWWCTSRMPASSRKRQATGRTSS